MGFTKIIATLSVAALACLTPSVRAQNQPLPWDGRGQDVTVATLDEKFLLHIFTQRQSGAGNPADYVTVEATGRSPAYNGDTGVINIAVDDKAIFNSQTNFRRSELVQNVASADTTFFRTSISANAEIKNKHVWQVFFPESHNWEVFVDATVTPNKIQFRTEGSVQWETEFTTKTWYNFGIAVASSSITLYSSTGTDDLVQVWTDDNSASPSPQELHFGMLTLTTDGSAPEMAAGQDILSFNGISVENTISMGSAGSTRSSRFMPFPGMPPSGEPQPPADNEPPSGEPEPPADDEPPSGEPQPPSGEPPSEESQPPADSEPPSGEPEPPADDEPPSGETEPPADNEPPSGEPQPPADSEPPSGELQPPPGGLQPPPGGLQPPPGMMPPFFAKPPTNFLPPGSQLYTKTKKHLRKHDKHHGI